MGGVGRHPLHGRTSSSISHSDLEIFPPIPMLPHPGLAVGRRTFPCCRSVRLLSSRLLPSPITSLPDLLPPSSLPLLNRISYEPGDTYHWPKPWSPSFPFSSSPSNPSDNATSTPSTSSFFGNTLPLSLFLLFQRATLKIPARGIIHGFLSTSRMTFALAENGTLPSTPKDDGNDVTDLPLDLNFFFFLIFYFGSTSFALHLPFSLFSLQGCTFQPPRSCQNGADRSILIFSYGQPIFTSPSSS
jgi:hypothetical protein